MSYIYKITNLINGKVYIGQTSLTPEIRFDKHKRCYKSNGCSKLYRAMRKYGKKNFIIETICKTNNPDIDEKYWIKYYNSVELGYNISYGGEGGSLRGEKDENIIIESFKRLQSIRKIYKETGYSRDYIRNTLKVHNIDYNSINTLKNIDEKLIIEKYNELKEVLKVSKELGISERTIRKYLRKNNIEIFNHKNDRYIYIACDKITHEEIKRFDNRKEIKLFLDKEDDNIYSGIERVINGERKSYKNYYWKKFLK